MQRLWERTALVLGTGLGFGMAPASPGTVGSLWGPFLVWGLRNVSPNLWVEALISALLILVGVPICTRAAEYFGRDDPGEVVWDEIAVFPIVYAGVPFGWQTAILGFVLFRVFDIWKPPPIRRFEKLPKGWGIMMDDVIAAVFACLCLHLVLLMLP